MTNDEQSGIEREVADLDEAAFIVRYLQQWDGQPRSVISTFSAVLRDARAASLRDVETGEPIHPEHSTSWLGAVGYMILLDQLGSTLRRRDDRSRRRASKRGFVSALERFAPELTYDQRRTLYALRNAFVHDYSLVSGAYHFLLYSADDGDLVTPASIPWDRRPSLPVDPSARVATTTIVNLRAFANLVEEIVRRLRKLALARELSIALPNHNNEFSLRYFFGLREAGEDVGPVDDEDESGPF